MRPRPPTPLVWLALALAFAGCAHTSGVEPGQPLPEIHALVGAADSTRLATRLDAAPGLVNQRDPLGNTPLMRAALMHEAGIARMLLDRGADVRATDKEGMTALHAAVRPGGRSLAGLLLDRGAVIDARTRHGFTPLDMAAHEGSEDVLGLLLEHGANPNGGQPDWSPLRDVVRHGLLNVTERMLDAGANVNARDVNGESALFFAARGGVTLQSEVVMSHLAHEQAPVFSSGDFAAVAEVLIRRGGDVHLAANYGKTALHAAAETNHADVAEVLLAHGADASAADKFGTTPLHTAADQGHVEAARVLLAHGAKVNAMDKQGWAPLNCAVRPQWSQVSEGQRPAVVALLIDHGADVNRTVPGGGWGFFRVGPSTSLEHAASQGQTEIVSLLLRAGADPNRPVKHGSTALQLALAKQHRETADTLLAHGAR